MKFYGKKTGAIAAHHRNHSVISKPRTTMKAASTFRSQFYFTRQCSNKLKSPKSPHLLLLIKTSTSKNLQLHTQTTSFHHPNKPLSIEPIISKTPIPSNQDLIQVSTDGRFSRFVILGAMTIGVTLFLVGMDDQKAFALGPEGHLIEEFWDNMRRYGLYIVTVSSGVIYTIFPPILELLKNPITVILIITILGGSFYIVTRVVSATVGVSEFVYDYAY